MGLAQQTVKNTLETSPQLIESLHSAREMALATDAAEVLPAHLMLAMLEDDESSFLLEAYGVDFEKTRNQLARLVVKQLIPKSAGRFGVFSSSIEAILDHAREQAHKNGLSEVDSNLTLAVMLSEEKNFLAPILNPYDLELSGVMQYLELREGKTVTIEPLPRLPTPKPAKPQQIEQKKQESTQSKPTQDNDNPPRAAKNRVGSEISSAGETRPAEGADTSAAALQKTDTPPGAASGPRNVGGKRPSGRPAAIPASRLLSPDSSSKPGSPASKPDAPAIPVRPVPPAPSHKTSLTAHTASDEKRTPPLGPQSTQPAKSLKNKGAHTTVPPIPLAKPLHQHPLQQGLARNEVAAPPIDSSRQPTAQSLQTSENPPASPTLVKRPFHAGNPAPSDQAPVPQEKEPLQPATTRATGSSDPLLAAHIPPHDTGSQAAAQPPALSPVMAPVQQTAQAVAKNLALPPVAPNLAPPITTPVPHTESLDQLVADLTAPVSKADDASESPQRSLNRAAKRRRTTPSSLGTNESLSATGSVLEKGRLIEAIPRAMTVHKPKKAEVRITRAQMDEINSEFEDLSSSHIHELAVTEAMTVQLRAPAGGFHIENLSPQTQWIDRNQRHIDDADFGVWRWTVTSTKAGKARLQLVISARTVDDDGTIHIADIPDKIINLSISRDYGRAAKTVGFFTLIALFGILLGKYGETAYHGLSSFLTRLI